ncbi:hypothetical protein [Ferroplasma sp.]|uniref:hypothetical protein n=1 Tax=Ferroplasma sp. TaxID=2591003 RepID=UPI00307F4867
MDPKKHIGLKEVWRGTPEFTPVEIRALSEKAIPVLKQEAHLFRVGGGHVLELMPT